MAKPAENQMPSELQGITDAVKELTKVVGDNNAAIKKLETEITLLRKSGKF